MISDAQHLVAPAPRRPIPLVSKQRRERARQRQRERVRDSDSDSLSWSVAQDKSEEQYAVSRGSSSMSIDHFSNFSNGSPQPCASPSSAGSSSRMYSRPGSNTLNHVSRSATEALTLGLVPSATEDPTLFEDVDRLGMEQSGPSDAHVLTSGGTHNEDVQSSADDADLAMNIDLLDPDLTPTKARLKLLRKTLSGDNTDSEESSPATSLTSPKHRESRQESGHLNHRIKKQDPDPLMASPPAAFNAQAGESLSNFPSSPVTPSRRRPLSSSSKLLPERGQDRHFPDIGSSPSTPSGQSGPAWIPPSPISRVHTRNPFNKSFFIGNESGPS
ncbi:unnamed protein product [Sympodiomycopsis kandeliae]